MAVDLKDVKWSYSRLGCYKQCHFKYKLKYVDKNYFFIGSVATEFGTAIHETEEAIANSIIANTPINYTALKNKLILTFAKLKYKYKDDWYVNDKYSNENYEEKSLKYLRFGIYRLQQLLIDNPNYRVVGAEVPIDFMYADNKRFTGSIDRLIYDTSTNTYLIQDIKTWPTFDKHEEDLTTPLQFVVYSLALAEMKSIPVNTIKCQYDLPLASEIRDAGTKGYITRGKNKLDSLFKGIFMEVYDPTPSALCAWCEYSVTNPQAPEEGRNLCPYHSVWDREVRDKETLNVPANPWLGLKKHEEYVNSLKGGEN